MGIADSDPFDCAALPRSTPLALRSGLKAESGRLRGPFDCAALRSGWLCQLGLFFGAILISGSKWRGIGFVWRGWWQCRPVGRSVRLRCAALRTATPIGFVWRGGVGRRGGGGGAVAADGGARVFGHGCLLWRGSEMDARADHRAIQRRDRNREVGLFRQKNPTRAGTNACRRCPDSLGETAGIRADR